MAKLSGTIQNTMYYNAPEFIIRLAKDLRANQTTAEKELWKIIAGKQLWGLHFRRQHNIGLYIADFYCHSIRLAIEIDGEIHNKKEKYQSDLNRTAELERLGITVIRFTNRNVFENITGIKTQIECVCQTLIAELGAV